MSDDRFSLSAEEVAEAAVGLDYVRCNHDYSKASDVQLGIMLGQVNALKWVLGWESLITIYQSGEQEGGKRA